MDFHSQYVNTDYGPIYVAFSNDLILNVKPVLITFHDIGFNHKTNFDHLFNNVKMRSMLKYFSIIHLNAPGQEESSISIKKNIETYPTFDEIVLSIHQVLEYFSIKSFLGFGVGAGANLLIRYSIRYPNSLDGLFLVNVSFNPSDWLNYLRMKFLWLGLKYRNRLTKKMFLKQFQINSDKSLNFIKQSPKFNMENLILFIDSYLNRTNLIINGCGGCNITCAVMIVAGALSSNYYDSERLAKKLDPANYEFIKVRKGNLILNDCTEIVIHIFQLFVQGLGYMKYYPLNGLQGSTDER